MIEKYENEQAVQALDKLIEFLNNTCTHIELIEITPIGKKYVAENGYDKKVIFLTADNAVITNFYEHRYVGRDIVFHNSKNIKQKINTVTNQLEKGAAESNVKLKMQYYWKRFKKITKESFRCQ